MQTRRDQLQAYRFQNRRALAALVKGEPNVLEPPMRRLTVMTLSGIMIAILIAAGFAALGLIHPSAGNSWKNSRAVIVDNDTASTFVYLHGTLHPVLNFTSAVLAVAGNGQVPRVTVSSGDIAKARYGAEIGIPEVPSALPPTDGLLGFPLSVCSVQQQQGTSGQVTARVTMTAATNTGGSTVPSSQAVVVAAASDKTQTYLLLQGKRLPIPAASVAALDLGSQPPLIVGTAFINSVPLGPTLAAPSIPQDGHTTALRAGGRALRVGTIVSTGGHGASYLVLSNGFAPLTAFERALFVGNPTQQVSQEYAVQHQISQATAISKAFLGLAPTPPTLDSAAATRAGVCAVYHDGDTTPRIELARQARPAFGGTVGESRTSSTGYADKISIPATKGVLATPANNPRTIVFISDQGRQYAFASSTLLAAFGYSHTDVTKVPAALLKLIPPGPGLQTGAARERVTLR